MTTLFEIFSSAALAETGGKIMEAAENLKTVENVKSEVVDINENKLEEIDISKVEYDESYNMEQEVLIESDHYMTDDIGLREKTQEFGNSEYINEIRNANEKVDNVLTKSEESLANDFSDLNIQRIQENLERYKGTIFEYELKDALGAHFETVEDKQQIVQTEWGETKPDVILRDALEDIKIGDLEVNKGEDLYIEAKCGAPEYIRGEMGHILQQVEGHEGKSLVVVSKDYLDINPETRVNFEKQLSEKGSHLYVADISSADVSSGLLNSLRN